MPATLLSGLLPFAAIFVELYFIMNSIWFHKAYYMFGFLFVCYFIMVRIRSPVVWNGLIGVVDFYVCDGDDIVDLLCSLFGELSLV